MLRRFTPAAGYSELAQYQCPSMCRTRSSSSSSSSTAGAYGPKASASSSPSGSSWTAHLRWPTTMCGLSGSTTACSGFCGEEVVGVGHQVLVHRRVLRRAGRRPPPRARGRRGRPAATGWRSCRGSRRGCRRRGCRCRCPVPARWCWRRPGSRGRPAAARSRAAPRAGSRRGRRGPTSASVARRGRSRSRQSLKISSAARRVRTKAIVWMPSLTSARHQVHGLAERAAPVAADPPVGRVAARRRLQRAAGSRARTASARAGSRRCRPAPWPRRRSARRARAGWRSWPRSR